MKATEKYPLLPFSQLVFDMARLRPKVYSFGAVFRWRGMASEADRLQEALRKALSCHAVFRMRTDWRGQQYLAPTGDILSGQYHRFSLRTEGADLYIHAEASRILGDGKSIIVLLEDIACAWRGEPLEDDGYVEYLKSVSRLPGDPHYLACKAWLEQEFADMRIPVRPPLDHRLFTLRTPKAGVFSDDYTSLKESIARLSETKLLSLDGFFSLCTALAIAEACHTDEAALTWAYEGRETPAEQRIFGSLHRDVPFRISRTAADGSRPASTDELIRETRRRMRNGIAHSLYPYTLTAPYSKRWNYAVNVLRATDLDTLRQYLPRDMEIMPATSDAAYALLDVEISEQPQALALTFRYSATHYKQDTIRRFAALVRHHAEHILKTYNP